MGMYVWVLLVLAHVLVNGASFTVFGFGFVFLQMYIYIYIYIWLRSRIVENTLATRYEL